MSRGSALSRTTSPEPDALRGLVLETSYDKIARLDIPVFQAEGGAKPSLPFGEAVERGLPLAALEAGCGASRGLAAAARALAAAMALGARFEPQNDTSGHRSYPSPRAIFPVTAHLVFERGEEEVRLRLEPEHVALVRDGSGPAPAGETGWSLRIELVADLDRIAPLYGDLSITLCALEAGHLAARICAALDAGGVAFACTRAPGPPSSPLVPLASIALPEVEAAPPDAAAFALQLRVSRPVLSHEARTRTGRAAARLASAPCAHAPLPLPTPATGNSHAEAPRSSGVFTNGMHGGRAASADIDALAEEITATYRLHPNGPQRPQLTLLRSLPDLDVRVLPLGHGAGSHLVPRGCRPLSDAYGTAFNIDLQTIPLIAVFSMEFATLLGGGSAWRYVHALIAAGAIAQHICEAAAARGFFARPFKGAVEERIESGFGISGQAFYTLLIGRQAVANPFFSLDPLVRP